MVVETGIFGGNKGINEVGREVGILYPDTVFIAVVTPYRLHIR